MGASRFGLLLRYLAQHVRRNPTRTALASSAVTVAVALYVALATSQAAIVGALERQVRSLAGGADVRIESPEGATAETLALVETLPGLRASPVVEQRVVAPGLGAEVLVLGVDFQRDARLRGYDLSAVAGPGVLAFLGKGIIVTQAFAGEHGLARGDTLTLATALGEEPFPVVAVVATHRTEGDLPANLVVMSVAAAQLFFDREERFDRIEVALGDVDVGQLRARLGKRGVVRPVTSSNPLLEWQLGQLRAVLHGATLLALLIGAFVVHGALALSVVERVKDLAILRALGVTRSAVVGALAAEAALLGATGALVGTGFGWLLASLLVRHSAAHVNLLGHAVDIAGVELEPRIALVGLALGTASALVGAAAPAWSAASVSPLEPLGRAVFAIRRRSRLELSSAAGTLACLAAFSPAVRGSHPSAALALLVAGAGLLVPALVVGLSGPARRWLKCRSFALTVAFDGLAQSPHRSGLSVTALAGGLALAVAVQSALGGFAGAAERWMDAVLPLDLTLQGNDFTRAAYNDRVLPASLLHRVASHPGVRLVFGSRVRLVPYATGAVALVALDVAEFARLRHERGVGGPADPFVVHAAALRHGAVLISSNLATLAGLRSGGRIALPTAAGRRELLVAGEVEDYSWPRGVIFIERSFYRRWWRDDTLTAINVALDPGAPLGVVRSDLAGLGAGSHAFVLSRAETKGRSLALVRSWFRLADAAIVLAALLGALGVSNALLISQVARAREIAIFRALGAVPAQIAHAIVAEAAIVGAGAGLLGALLGLLVVRFPLRWMTRAESGYDLPFRVESGQVATAVLVGIVVAVLAAVPPLRVARGRGVVQQIGYQ